MDSIPRILSRTLPHLRTTTPRLPCRGITAPSISTAKRNMSTSIEQKLDVLRNYSACDVCTTHGVLIIYTTTTSSEKTPTY